MKTSHHASDTREQLLATEPINPTLQSEYERKMTDMFETKLTRKKRLWLMLFAVVSMAGCVFAIVLSLTEVFPTRAVRVVIPLYAVFAAAWAIYFVRIILRGTMRRRIDPVLAAGMAYGFSLLTCILFLFYGVSIDRVLLMGMILLLPASILVVRTIVEQSELRTQEQLLVLQYKLSKLAEKFDDDSGDAGAGVLR